MVSSCGAHGGERNLYCSSGGKAYCSGPQAHLSKKSSTFRAQGVGACCKQFRPLLLALCCLLNLVQSEGLGRERAPATSLCSSLSSSRPADTSPPLKCPPRTTLAQADMPQQSLLEKWSGIRFPTLLSFSRPCPQLNGKLPEGKDPALYPHHCASSGSVRPSTESEVCIQGMNEG